MVSKKAGLQALTGILLFIIFTFVIVLISAVFMYMGHEIEDAMLNSSIATKEAAGRNYSSIIQDVTIPLNRSLANLRWISWFLILGMILSIILGCFLTPSKPVFFVFYIFLLIAAIIFAVIISNSYEMIRDKNADLLAYFNTMPASNFLMLNMPLIVLVVGILGGIAMYGSFKVFKED